VPQDDTLLATLTPAECLTYHALLRLPTHLSPGQVQVSTQAGPPLISVWLDAAVAYSLLLGARCSHAVTRHPSAGCFQCLSLFFLSSFISGSLLGLSPPCLQAQVSRVLQELGLQGVAGTRVGGGTGGRGISGGERRR